jgi:hypothetical protein
MGLCASKGEPTIGKSTIGEPTVGVVCLEAERCLGMPLTPAQDVAADYMWITKSLASSEVIKLQKEGWSRRDKAPFTNSGYPKGLAFTFVCSENKISTSTINSCQHFRLTRT